MNDPFSDGDVTQGTDPYGVHWRTSDNTHVSFVVLEDPVLDPVAPHRVADFRIENPHEVEKDDYIFFALPELVTLAVGEAIEVTFALRFAGGPPRADASRTGVSLGYRSTGHAPWSHGDNREYSFFTSYGATGSHGSIRKSAGLQFLNAGTYLANGTMSANFEDRPVTVRFEVARLAENRVRVRYQLHGGPVQEAFDEDADFFTFSHVFWRYRRATTEPRESMRIDEVTVQILEADLSERKPQVWYVSTDGNDGASGTSLDEAFQSIQWAAQWARAGDEIVIRGGVYRERVRPAASGTDEAPVVFRAYEMDGLPEEVIVSAFDVVTPGEHDAGDWTVHSGAIHAIQLPEGSGFTGATDMGRNLVLLGGEALREARWPSGRGVVDFDYRRMARAESGFYNPDSAGPQAPYSRTFYTGWYGDSALAAFEEGAWVGAHIDLNPGHGWWHQTGVVTASMPGAITFRWDFIANWGEIGDPRGEDPYFLWGHLSALDEAGEAFYDIQGVSGPPRKLYVWAPDGGSPSGQSLEIRSRRETFHLAGRENIELRNLYVLGGAVTTDSLSARILIDGVESRFGGYNLNQLTSAEAAINLRGEGHTLRDSTVRDVFGHGIIARERGVSIENCVVLNAMLHPISGDNATQASVTYNTVIGGGNTGISIGAKASLFAFNHVYDVGLRITDIAVMNTWNSGDGMGTEIAYNWVHSNRARHDLGLRWWGGQGIRLDSGGASLGCSAFVIHHNVVWGTTSNSSVTAWALEEGMVNYGAADIGIFHNTVENSVTIGGRGSAAGMDIRRNLAVRFNNASGATDGLFFSDNLFVETDHRPANLLGDPGYMSPRNRNYRLRGDSIARDVGKPIPGVSEPSTAAYLGAYNPQAAPWRPGARLRFRDLQHLSVALLEDNPLERQVRVQSSTRGRTFPDEFAIRVAGRTFAEGVIRYHFESDRAEAIFSLDFNELEGSFPVEYSLDGVNFFDVGDLLESTSFVVSEVSSPVAPSEGGSHHVLSGGGFFGADYDLIPLRLSGLCGKDLSSEAVPWIVDTTGWANAAYTNATGDNLRVFEWDGRRPVRHQVESGLGQPNTLLWLLANSSGTPDTGVASFEDQSLLYLAFADLDAPSVDDLEVLTDSFPALRHPSLLLHLRANQLAGHPEGAAVALWTDESGAGMDAVQSDPAAQPLYRPAAMNGLPSLEFDGVNDHFNVNGAGGLGTGPGRFFTVFRNPDPGTVLWQRLFSSRSGTDQADFQTAHFATVPTDGSGLALAHDTPQVRDAARNDGYSRENFRIGRRSLSEAEPFRGEIAEIIGFAEPIAGDDRAQVVRYLRRKYGIVARPAIEVLEDEAIAGIRVFVDGVEASGVRRVDGGQVAFRAPPYAGEEPLPVTVDVQLVLPDGSARVLPLAFTYSETGVLTAHEAWRLEWFGTAAATGVAHPLYDYNGNGLVNLFEYALGGDPLAPSVGPRPIQGRDGNHLTLEFFRAREDVIYEVLASTDLGEWNVIAMDPGVVGERVKVVDPIALSANEPVRFLALHVREKPGN